MLCTLAGVDYWVVYLLCTLVGGTIGLYTFHGVDYLAVYLGWGRLLGCVSWLGDY
jgi:hypothetical protein